MKAEQYEYMCLGLAQARPNWDKLMFQDMCSRLGADPEDVKSMKLHGYTIPQYDALRNGDVKGIEKMMSEGVLK
jgi:hypothetical protein